MCNLEGLTTFCSFLETRGISRSQDISGLFSRHETNSYRNRVDRKSRFHSPSKLDLAGRKFWNSRNLLPPIKRNAEVVIGFKSNALYIYIYIRSPPRLALFARLIPLSPPPPLPPSLASFLSSDSRSSFPRLGFFKNARGLNDDTYTYTFR